MDSIKFFNDKNLLNSSTNAKSNSKNNNIDTIKTSETVNIDKYKNKVNEVLNFATTSLESVPNKQEESERNRARSSQLVMPLGLAFNLFFGP